MPSTPKPKPKRTPKQIGRSSKRKGKAYEKEVAEYLAEVFPAATPGSRQQVRTEFLPDVANTPYWIECKSRMSTNPKQALKQAEQEATDSGDNREGIAFCKDPPIAGRKNEYVTMRVHTFIELLRKAFLSAPELTPHVEKTTGLEADESVQTMNKKSFTALLKRRKLQRMRKTKPTV